MDMNISPVWVERLQHGGWEQMGAGYADWDGFHAEQGQSGAGGEWEVGRRSLARSREAAKGCQGGLNPGGGGSGNFTADFADGRGWGPGNGIGKRFTRRGARVGQEGSGELGDRAMREAAKGAKWECWAAEGAEETFLPRISQIGTWANWLTGKASSPRPSPSKAGGEGVDAGC